MGERILKLAKETPVQVTIGSAVAIIFVLMSAMGVGYKAKHDLEAANARQDAEIDRLADKINNLKDGQSDLLREVGIIREDIKTLLRRVP